MAITGINNYPNQYAQYTSQAKNDNKAESKEKPAQKGVEKNIQNQEVSDYYNYLQKNFDAMKGGNVAISGEYLKKCASDGKTAKELEEFLKKIPELEEQGYKDLSARNKALGGTVTYYQQSWVINKDGSVQSTVYSVTETEMTNAERMKKTMDERLEKQKEKKAEEKQKEEKEEKEKIKEKSLEDNKLYRSMKINYIDVSSMENLPK